MGLWGDGVMGERVVLFNLSTHQLFNPSEWAGIIKVLGGLPNEFLTANERE